MSVQKIIIRTSHPHHAFLVSSIFLKYKIFPIVDDKTLLKDNYFYINCQVNQKDDENYILGPYENELIRQEELNRLSDMQNVMNKQ